MYDAAQQHMEDITVPESELGTRQNHLTCEDLLEDLMKSLK